MQYNVHTYVFIRAESAENKNHCVFMTEQGLDDRLGLFPTLVSCLFCIKDAKSQILSNVDRGQISVLGS